MICGDQQKRLVQSGALAIFGSIRQSSSGVVRFGLKIEVFCCERNFGDQLLHRGSILQSLAFFDTIQFVNAQQLDIFNWVAGKLHSVLIESWDGKFVAKWVTSKTAKSAVEKAKIFFGTRQWLQRICPRVFYQIPNFL